LLFFQDETCLFEYYDFDFIRRARTFIIFFLRSGEECLLRRISLSVRDAPSPPLSNPDLLVSLHRQPEHFFLLNRFDSNYLTSKRDLFGYRLHDITAFQKRVQAIETAYQHERTENMNLKALLSKSPRGQEFIGVSKVIRQVRETAEKAAATQATVLIQGPTGSGKEVLAEFIHAQSERKDGPLIKVDCSVLTKTLMESQLFGHEKGAFTGADKRHIGLLERAHKGTVFLDEMNNLTPEAQAKLLHFLQDHTIERVGGSEAVKLDVRILCASNLPLEELAEQGLFRKDLYFRLAVITIRLPALKDRLEDLPVLCNHFLQRLNLDHKKTIAAISHAAYRKMYAFPWPGNIRELKNVLERAVVFCEGSEIDADQIAFTAASRDNRGETKTAPGVRKKRKALNVDEKGMEDVILSHDGNMKQASAALGISIRALYYHLRKINRNPNDFRKNPYRN
jgi:DNA-binding NtrC family response regulator